MKRSLSFLPLVFFLLHFVEADLKAQDRLSGEVFSTRSEVIAQNGMAATNHPLASQIAMDILKKGGSAVDAAIAANAFLGFADPAMNGPGGDLFAIVWSADDQSLYGLNASGKSPRGLDSGYFSSRDISRIPNSGPLSVTVPGAVDGWFELHDKFGQLDFSELMSPAVRYAREGVAITAETADLMDYLERDLIRFYDLPETFEWNDLPNFSELYRQNGRFPKKGELFKNPELANTLELLGSEGRSVFYRGEIAETIVAHMQEEGGFLTMDDFAEHTSLWTDPVSVDYRGYDIWQMPPNTQGMAALQILNILEGYDLSEYGFGSKEHIHYYTEAKKLAYGDLNEYYGDPEFNELPIDELLSKEYAASRRQEIRDDWSQTYGPGLESGTHTIYLTVADGEGNMVSLIQSNAWLFGSLMIPPGLGFPIQNRGSGFTLREDHVNSYEPGKRPFHTIIPSFVTKDGDPFISFGLTGGDMQSQGHVQIVMNVIDFGMNIQEAADAPRIRHAGGSSADDTGAVELESGFQYETIRELMKMGHKVTYGFERFGGFQGILFDGTFYYGASDPRKDGQASGY